MNCAELQARPTGWRELASNRADAARDRIDKRLLVGLETTQRGEGGDSRGGEAPRSEP